MYFFLALAAKTAVKPEIKPAVESKADAGKMEAKADAKSAVNVDSKSSAISAAEGKEIEAPVKQMLPETKTNLDNSNEFSLSAQEQDAKKNNVYAPVYDSRPVSYGPSYSAPASPAYAPAESAYRPPASTYNNQNSYSAPQYGNNAYQHDNHYNNHYKPNDCKKTAILKKINEKVTKALENSKSACSNVELLSNIKSLVNLALLNSCNNGYKAEGQHHQEKLAAEGHLQGAEHLKKSFLSKSKKSSPHLKPAKEW